MQIEIKEPVSYAEKKQRIRKELDLIFDKKDSIEFNIDLDVLLTKVNDRNKKIAKCIQVLKALVDHGEMVTIVKFNKIKNIINNSYSFAVNIGVTDEINKLNKAKELVTTIIFQIKNHKIKKMSTLKDKVKPLIEILQDIKFTRGSVRKLVTELESISKIKKVDVLLNKDFVSTASVPVIFHLGEKFDAELKNRLSYQLGMKFVLNYCYIPEIMVMVLNTSKRIPKTIKQPIDDFNANQALKICQIINTKTHSALLPIQRFSSNIKGRYITLLTDEKFARLFSEIEKRTKKFEFRIALFNKEAIK